MTWLSKAKQSKPNDYIWLSYILTEKIRGSKSRVFLCGHKGWKSTSMFQES